MFGAIMVRIASTRILRRTMSVSLRFETGGPSAVTPAGGRAHIYPTKVSCMPMRAVESRYISARTSLCRLCPGATMSL